jgi:hypothetical protein
MHEAQLEHSVRFYDGDCSWCEQHAHGCCWHNLIRRIATVLSSTAAFSHFFLADKLLLLLLLLLCLLQNKFGGTITAKVTASSIVYEITMGPGTKFTTGDIHVYASCSPLTGNKFAPGQLNCNPATATPPACTTTGQLLASGSQYKATINFSCPKGQLFTAFHLGL